MENADLATETEKVIILSPNVQVDTPISLKQQVDQLIQEGKQVLSLIPNASVVAKFNEMGNNPVDPSIRKVIAAASREQGLADSNKVKEFLKIYNNDLLDFRQKRMALGYAIQEYYVHEYKRLCSYY